MNKKGRVGIVIFLVVLIIALGVGGYFIYSSFFGEPQKIKVNSLEITNIYRDCTINPNGNFRDITIQTTIDVDITKNKKYSLKLRSDDCILKIGPNEINGFALNKIPVSTPYVEGIESSGLHMVTGGELRGDISDVLTFCCQGKCDTANLEICS